ncbi:MAG: hypothetical protein OHK0045_04010 [Raineya sp.]
MKNTKKFAELKNGYNPERYTIKGLVTDFFLSIYHLSRKKVVHTAIELTLCPAKSVRFVIRGFRKYLYNPLEYLIIAATLISLLNERYHFFANEATTQMAENERAGIYALDFFFRNKEFFDAFFKYSEEFPSVVNIVALPVFALTSYIFFKDYRYNLAENLILNTYITAQQLLFLIVLVPFDELFHASKEILIGVYTLATMGYNIWVYTTFFSGKLFPKIARAVFTVLFAYILQFPVNVLVYYFFAPVFEFLSKF